MFLKKIKSFQRKIMFKVKIHFMTLHPHPPRAQMQLYYLSDYLSEHFEPEQKKFLPGLVEKLKFNIFRCGEFQFSLRSRVIFRHNNRNDNIPMQEIK